MSLAARYRSAAIRQLAKRKHRSILDRKADIRGMCFPQQLAFIEDPCKLKAAFCTRRAAKSYTGGLYAIKTALEHPGLKILYVALTRDSARLIFWNDVLKNIVTKLNLQVRFQESLLEATFANGAMIKLLGMNTTEQEKEKALGQKYVLIIIDEAASFTIDLRDLVYKTLEPATIDNAGTICLLGTPSNLKRGLFFEVTREPEQNPAWSLHRWHTLDNPHTRDEYLAKVAEIKEKRPLFMLTAAFKQMYLGEWAIEDEWKVYKFSREFNTAAALPTDRKYRWNYVLGLDLGFDDDTAFVVMAYAPTCPNLYVVHAEKHKGLDFTGVAQKVLALEGKFPFEFQVVDGANKQGVAEMNNRHGLCLEAADKTGKVDFIELMNDEFIQRKIYLLPAAECLAAEYDELIWDEKAQEKKKKVEHPNCDNHATDASLYSWRYTYTYLSLIPKDEVIYGSEAWQSQEEDKHIAARDRKIRGPGEGEFPAHQYYRSA